MAGGLWTIQNKVLPGVYVNFVGKSGAKADVSITGVVALPVSLPWFPEQTVFEVQPENALEWVKSFGKGALPVREAAKKASKLLLYRLNSGTAATGSAGILQLTAKYSGSFGNTLKFSLEAVAGQSGSFRLVTYVGVQEVERETVVAGSFPYENDWIKFGMTEESLSATTLSGGTDDAITNQNYVDALAAFEVQEFNTIACLSDTDEVKQLFLAWAKRLIHDEGRYIQAVIPNMKNGDFEGIISVANGVKLAGGEVVDKVAACAYIAGASAGVPLTTSLTNSAYPGAVDVDTRYTLAEQTDLAKSGQMIFIPGMAGGEITIQKDINTLVSYTETRGYTFTLNKIIRTIYFVASEIKRIGMSGYVGKMGNHPAGRDLYKADILACLRELERRGVLLAVSPEQVMVERGASVDGVAYITINGRNIQLFYLKSVEAKLKKNKKEVRILGNRVVGHKTLSATGTGTLSIKEYTSEFREVFLRYLNDGIDTYFELMITNEDKSSGRGREVKRLTGCNFDEMTIAKLATEDEVFEQEMPFTFEGVELLQSYND